MRDHLRTGTAIPIGIDDAVETAEMIDDIYRAAGFDPRPSHSSVTG